MSALFVGIPDVLHFAEYRLVHAVELLELVNDKRETPCLRQPHQVSENLAEASAAAQRWNAELVRNFLHIGLAEFRFSLSGHKEIDEWRIIVSRLN